MSPRVAIADGAHFRGSVDMQRKGAPPQAQAGLPPRPATAPAPTAAPATHVAQPAAR